MRSERPDIEERTVVYALRTGDLARKLESDGFGRILGRQLLRAGTSVGANVHEAQGAQSRADFISKMSIAFKEARETAYWLRVITRGGFVSDELVEPFRAETEEIVRILASILLTAKGIRNHRAQSGSSP